MNGIEDLIKTFEIDLPQDDVQCAIRRKLANHQTPVPKGFRAPEFMPLQYVLRKFGEEFISGILQELLTKQVNDRIIAEGWDVATTHIAGKWSVNDRPLRYIYQVTLDLYPKFEVRGLDTLQLRTPARTLVDDSHIDAAIEVLRRGHSQWKPVNRPSAPGDRVTVNFNGILADGSPFPGGKADNVGVELGAGGMLPEFEQNLTGVTAGQHLDFSVCFPPDYGTPILRGQTAFFSVSVLTITEFELAPLDDAFAKKCEVEGGLAELREKTRIHLQQQHDAQDQRDTDSDLLRQLVMANIYPLPQSLIQQQLQALYAETALERGVDIDQLRDDEGLFEQAQYRVHLSVVVRQLILQEKLQFASNLDLTEQVVKWLKNRAS